MSYYPTSSHPQVGPSQYKRAKNDMPLVGIYEDVSRLCKQTRLAPVPPLLGRTVEETAWRHEDVRWAREFQPRAHFAKLAARNARDSSAQNYVQRDTVTQFPPPARLALTYPENAYSPPEQIEKDHFIAIPLKRDKSRKVTEILRNRVGDACGLYKEGFISGNFAKVVFEPYDHWEETSEGEINNTGSEEGGVGVILISDELPRVGRDVLDVLCDPRAPRLGRFTFYPGPCDDKEVKEILKPFNEILEATDGFNEVVGCSENVYERIQSFWAEIEAKRKKNKTW